MDVIKSRLTRARRALDIAFPQIVFKNGITNMMVYDWACVLADRMEEFMTLQHRTFYMPHHAIGLFLEAALHQFLAQGEPPIFYWQYLDTGGTIAGQNRVMQGLTMGETDSDRKDTSESEETTSKRDNSLAEDKTEVTQTVSSPKSLFALSLLPATTHLIPTIATPSIPRFGQRRPQIDMTVDTYFDADHKY